MATDITEDCQEIHNATYKAMYNRLKPKIGKLSSHSGDYKKYGQCKRIMKYQEMTILPISYCSHRQTLGKKKAANLYTPEGRTFRHRDLSFPNASMTSEIACHPIIGQSIEYNDNRVSLFSAQYGKCAITGRMFLDISEIHCHHKTPRYAGGKDNYQNLVLILPEVHRLIHAKKDETIKTYLKTLCLDSKQINKLNRFRIQMGLAPITNS